MAWAPPGRRLRSRALRAPGSGLEPRRSLVSQDRASGRAPQPDRASAPGEAPFRVVEEDVRFLVDPGAEPTRPRREVSPGLPRAHGRDLTSISSRWSARGLAVTAAGVGRFPGLSSRSARPLWADMSFLHRQAHVLGGRKALVPDDVAERVLDFGIRHALRQVFLDDRELATFGVDQVLTPSASVLFDRVPALLDGASEDCLELVRRQRALGLDLLVFERREEKPEGRDPRACRRPSSPTSAPPRSSPAWGLEAITRESARRSYPSSVKRLLVGTAGHIDHGKTALVRALTGDRRRPAPGGEGARDHHRPRVRPVDCRAARWSASSTCPATSASCATCWPAPAGSSRAAGGGRRRIRDAPDPRALRHLRLLGWRPAWSRSPRRRVRRARRGRAGGRCAELAAALPGGRAAAGLGEDRRGSRGFQAALVDLASRRAPLDEESPRGEAIARLPVDRAFLIAGFGPVVTGSLVSGGIRKDDRLEVLPDRRPVRVRRLEVHGHEVDEARAGERVSAIS